MSSTQLTPMPDPLSNRQGSIRSVASNSSLASSISLSRRSRITRARSRTMTGTTAPDFNNTPKSTMSELPYLDDPINREPMEGPSVVSQNTLFLSHQPSQSLKPPEPEFDTRSSSTGMGISHNFDHATQETTFVDHHPSPVSGKQTKAARQALLLPVIETSYKPPPSAFSRDPALTPTNIRDSVSTQTSSSIYPPSTSTASGPESPLSPRSVLDQADNFDFSQLNPEVNEMQDYDNDDVSYRLRLLVKNNYFLPPAHSKPSPSDFALSVPNASKKPARSTTPTFLDLFRVGKSKSKPSTPPAESAPPMLRTTSDSIAASYALRSQPLSPNARTSPHPPINGSRGRVVVVRERMKDITVAAKQAELDLKTRGVRVDQYSQRARQDMFDNVIDPTDAVDLPLPSSSYPFAVQASALHGLGVQDSVGAADLADRLVPQKGPNSSYDTEDDWRKALLHEAVHHSLDNTPDISSFSQVMGASTPFASPGPNTSASESSHRGASPVAKVVLGQRIVEPSMLEQRDTSSLLQVKDATSKPNLSVNTEPSGVSNVSYESSRPSSFLPLRADTPSGPMTPLTPPPPRRFINPLYSLSQTDLHGGNGSHQELASRPTSPPPHAIRTILSTPMLSDSYDSLSVRDLSTDLPPVPSLTIYSRASSQVTEPFDTSAEYRVAPSFMSTGSRYSDDGYMDGGDLPRTSMALSAVNGRPFSLDYSQSSLSPTTSAFQDMLNREDLSSASMHPRPSLHSSIEHPSTSHSSMDPRNSTMSPPPRISSSLAHVALSPPPRSSSFNYLNAKQSLGSITTLDRDRFATTIAEDQTMEFTAPSPTTPPLPLPSPHATDNQPSHSLNITSNFTPSIHSAPAPSSPTSFFDTIQTQPNAMDDLESSSDEDDGDEQVHSPSDPRVRGLPFNDPRARAISNASAPSGRPPIMRLGNYSMPYVTGSSSGKSSGNGVRSRPVGNVPSQPGFFVDRKGDAIPGPGIPASTLDFFKYAQDHPGAAVGGSGGDVGGSTRTNVAGATRPSTADNVVQWRNNQRAQESLRKLDGMLIQHMEAEKDTIKRIATTMKHLKNADSPTQP